jgi:hypothetical protein
MEMKGDDPDRVGTEGVVASASMNDDDRRTEEGAKKIQAHLLLNALEVQPWTTPSSTPWRIMIEGERRRYKSTFGDGEGRAVCGVWLVPPLEASDSLRRPCCIGLPCDPGPTTYTVKCTLEEGQYRETALRGGVLTRPLVINHRHPQDQSASHQAPIEIRPAEAPHDSWLQGRELMLLAYYDFAFHQGTLL